MSSRICEKPMSLRAFHLCPRLSGGFLLILLSACQPTKPRTVTPAFYHWKTSLALGPSERAYLEAISCKKLYVKVLDVGRDPATGKIVPLSRLEISDTTGLASLEMIPTVFITNEVFKDISEDQLEWLAAQIPPHLFQLLKRTTAREVQFDCDWTPSTRAAYFSFLQKLKKQLPPETRLSATIRLHQYKFPKDTGVPPVERGMLMFYNTGDIDEQKEVNSIFQPEAARKYLAGAPAHYPLPLDLALPLFSWTLVFRDDNFWKIIPEFPDDDLRDTIRFDPTTNDSSRWKVRKGTFIAGHYLRPGDLLRRESISPELLRQAARLAADMDLADDASIAFFHLDSAIIRRYPVQLIDSVCQMIR